MTLTTGEDTSRNLPVSDHAGHMKWKGTLSSGSNSLIGLRDT